MNLAEGAKRTYIVFSVLCVAGYFGSQFPQYPGNSEQVEWSNGLFTSEMKEAVVAGLRRTQSETFANANLDWNGADKAPGFFDDMCAGKLRPTHSSGVSPGLLSEVTAVCERRKASVETLPSRKLKFIGETVAGGVAIGIGAWLFWLLAAWIGRGFMQPKSNKTLS